MALSQQDLQAFWSAAPKPAAPSGPSGIGGFLARNAGTIGSVALPGIADILTGGLALPADAALSAIGGAGGQAISNAAQHKSLTNDLLSQALSGGAGAIGGRMIGGAGGLLGKVVTKPIDNGVAKAAEDKLAQDNLAKVTPWIGTNVKGKDLAGAFQTLETHGVDTSAPNIVSNMHKAADLVTGEPGVVNGTKRQILDSSAPVNVSGVMDATKNALIHERGLLGDEATKGTAGNGVLSSVRNTLQSTAYGDKGSLTGTADANKVLDTIQTLQDRVKELGGVKAPGINGAEARVKQQTINSLRSSLGAAADKNVEAFKLAPDDEAAIRARASAQDMPQLGEHVIQTINNAKSVADLQKGEAPFVNASQLAQAADEYAKGPGFIKTAQNAAQQTASGNPYRNLSTMYEAGAAAHGNPIAAGMLVTKAAKSPAVIDKAGNILSKVRVANNILPGKATIGQELARTAGQTMSHRQDSTAPSSTPSGSNTSLADALSAVQPAGQTTAPADDNSPFSGGNIQKALAADIAMTGGKHISELLSLYNTFGKPQDTLTTNQKNEVTGSQKAQQALGDYANQLDAAGGGKGVVGGNIENIAGKLGLGGDTAAAAHALESQRIDVAASVAGALSPTGKPTASITKIVADSLPTIKDTPAVARFKLQQLMTRIQNGELTAQQPISGNATDLTSALGGA